MEKFAITQIGKDPLRIVQSFNLSDEEQDLLLNYSMPFGSDWRKLSGKRSLKLFPISASTSCVAITAIQKESGSRVELYCLAAIAKNQEVETLIIRSSNWTQRFFSPFLGDIQNKKLKTIFRKAIANKTGGTKRQLRFNDWVMAQLHRPISFQYGNKEIANHEEYIMDIFLSTRWQRHILRFFSSSVMLPSFTTITTSANEFTRIKCLGV